jgi:hypothetical protein
MKTKWFTERLVVKIDLDRWTYLQQRSRQTGAPVSELVRRAINFTRYAEQQAEKAGK